MAPPTNQRRSQRLFLQVPVILEGQLPNKKSFSENAFTVVVNAHGALIELRVPLNQGQTVTLRNVRTNKSNPRSSWLPRQSPGNSQWRWNSTPLTPLSGI
jgi:hypothetical protein